MAQRRKEEKVMTGERDKRRRKKDFPPFFGSFGDLLLHITPFFFSKNRLQF
jgi:hypothetical protein